MNANHVKSTAQKIAELNAHYNMRKLHAVSADSGYMARTQEWAMYAKSGGARPALNPDGSRAK